MNRSLNLRESVARNVEKRISSCPKAVANRPRRSTTRYVPHIWEGNLSGSAADDEVSTSAPTAVDALIALQHLEKSFGKGSKGRTTIEIQSRFLWSSEVLFLQTEEKPKQRDINKDKKQEYFANVGDAIRTLRDDIPDLFNKDLNCESGNTHIHPCTSNLALDSNPDMQRMF